MLGEQKTTAILKQVLSYSAADQTEVLLLGEDSGLTRFANSYIHQNVSESDRDVRVRVVLGKKIGVASTNDLSAEGLRKVVESATTIARLQQDNPDFHSLPGKAGGYARVQAFAEQTAAVTPEQRARAVAVICQKCQDAGIIGSGALTTAVRETAIANSLGVQGYDQSTIADFSTVVMADTGAGYAAATSTSFADFDFEALANEAVGKALRSRDPIALAPGEYPTILEEYAVADMVIFLGYLGFSAQAVAEGRSFMKLGEKVAGDNISIWDDGLDARGLPRPFDYEGTPKRRLSLIEAGVAKNVVHDTYTAGKEGKQSTGHALPAPNTFGPMPFNMFMATGAGAKDELLKGTKRGLWVTRFHYTRPVHPLKVIVTGMTRDGTFLIEDGEITRPVKNFRFTQSYLDAFSHTETVAATDKLITGLGGAVRVPAIKVSSFNFTGATNF